MNTDRGWALADACVALAILAVTILTAAPLLHRAVHAIARMTPRDDSSLPLLGEALRTLAHADR